MKARMTYRVWAIAGMALVLAATGAFAAMDDMEGMHDMEGMKDMEEVEDLYPLSTCPVSAMDLGAMGDPLIKDYDGREVRFCCGECPAKFEKDLPASLAKLDEKIIEIQQDTYPLKTCMISGEELGGDMGDPIDLVRDNQLVRFCCKGCIKKFDADPAHFLSMLNDARSGKGEMPMADGSHGKHEEMDEHKGEHEEMDEHKDMH